MNVESVTVTRRSLLRGAAGAGALAVTAPLLSSCGANPTTIITWVGSVAGIIGAIPAAKDIAGWVRGEEPNQVVGRRVRTQFRSPAPPSEPFTNEDGAKVFVWGSTYFFAAASEDGLSGCCAFIADGQMLQAIESRGAAALHAVLKSERDRFDESGLAETFVPTQVAPKESLIGNLAKVDSAFRYKTALGEAEFRYLGGKHVAVTATLPNSETVEWTVTSPENLRA